MKMWKRPVWMIVGAIVLIAIVAWALPLPSRLLKPANQPSLRILDRSGMLLYEQRADEHGLQRTSSLASLPKLLKESVVAVEDRSFFRHRGISIRGIGRSVITNFTQGKIVSGGSTITQQLVRIRLGRYQRSIPRKIREIYYALKLERVMTKEEILENYLNSAYFGHQAYGIDAAAHTYFSKSPAELSVAETALIVGLLQSPTALDPLEHPSAARTRQNIVLQVLVEQEVIDQQTLETAKREPVSFKPSKVRMQAPHFVQWILATREDLPNTGDLQTTLDLHLQRSVEDIVTRNVEELRDRNVTSAAVVVLDAVTGDILSMVGSPDYFNVENEGAVNGSVALRQPGSTIKPFTYALALQRGQTAATTIADTEEQFTTKLGPYTPRNYDYEEHGLVTVRDALANSYNIAAVKTAGRVGVDRLLAMLREAGLTSLRESPDHYGLALTLGDGEVRLLDLASAYGTFARLGKKLSVRSLMTDPSSEGKGQQILDARIAWIIADILSDNQARLPEFGSDTPLSFPFPVAAKTGTTRNARDNWTVGFTSKHIVAVWVGNPDNSPMKNTSGVTGAGPMFHEVFLAVEGDEPAGLLPEPPGIVHTMICLPSGLLPNPACDETRNEKFIKGTEPTKQDAMHRMVKMDRRNGLLASSQCPASVVTERHFLIFPPELRTWAQRHGYASPPTKISPLCEGTVEDPTGEERWIRITSPHDGDTFGLDPLVPNANERITFSAEADASVRTGTWIVNGQRVAEATAPRFVFGWQPKVGRFVLEFETSSGNDRVRFSVEDLKQR